MAELGADKLLFFHRTRLREKYGTSGARRVVAALDRLIDADDDRGVESVRVDLSSTRSLKKYGRTRVADENDVEAIVDAVQTVAALAEPDYVALIGGPDVIPHVALDNPLAGTADPDPDVLSDLPYACTNGFTTDATTLVAPSRAVGRLPDLPGAHNPNPLIAIIDAARAWIPFTAEHYRSHLTVSTVTWKGSTEESSDRLFGGVDVRLAPPDGPVWTDDELERPTHFLNLHGATADPRFFGEDFAGAFPVAHSSTEVAGRIAPGALCTAECCYGAEIFDPAFAGGVEPIPHTYLQSGAYAYVGATGTSYGPPIGNGGADLLCRFFLEEVFGGASTGRAFLQARHRYIRDQPILRPVDAKNLAQFILLGDPSIHPVVRIGDARAPLHDLPDPNGDAPKSARIATRLVAPGRAERRRNLEAAAWALGQTTVVATDDAAEVPDDLVAKITTVAGVRVGAGARAKDMALVKPAHVHGLGGPQSRLGVVVAPRRGDDDPPRRRRPRPRSSLRRAPQAVDLVVVTAKIDDGEIVGWSTAMSR
ncbi:MAG: C25 family cysteine peptidase [Acidimicrobiales bacterium]